MQRARPRCHRPRIAQRRLRRSRYLSAGQPKRPCQPITAQVRHARIEDRASLARRSRDHSRRQRTSSAIRRRSRAHARRIVMNRLRLRRADAEDNARWRSRACASTADASSMSPSELHGLEHAVTVPSAPVDHLRNDLSTRRPELRRRDLTSCVARHRRGGGRRQPPVKADRRAKQRCSSPVRRVARRERRERRAMPDVGARAAGERAKRSRRSRSRICATDGGFRAAPPRARSPAECRQ